MPLTDSDALVLKVKADIKELQKGLRAAAREADIAGKSMQSSIGGKSAAISAAVGDMVSKVGIGLAAIATAAAAAGAAFAAMAKRTFDYADSLTKAADMTGLGTEALQEYRYAASQVGLEVGELEQGLQFFTKRLGEARNGASDAVKGFKALGLQQAELQQSTPEQALARVLVVLEQIPNAADRAAYANEAFGKSGARIALLASQGAGALGEMTQRARDLGLVIDDSLIRSGDSAGDALDRLKRVIESGLMRAVLQAAPVIEGFFNELTADPRRIQETARAIVEVAKAGGEMVIALANAITAARNLKNSDLGLFVSDLAERVNRFNPAMQIFASLLDRVSGVKIELPKLEAPRQVDNDPLSRAQAIFDGAAAATQLGPLNSDDLDRKREKLEAELKQQAEHNAQVVDQARQLAATEEALVDLRYQQRRAALEKMSQAEYDAAATTIGETRGRNDLLLALEESHKQDIDAIRAEANNAYVMGRTMALETIEAETMGQMEREMAAEHDRLETHLAMLEQTNGAELEALGGYLAAKEAMIAASEGRVAKIKEGYLQSGLSFLQRIDNAELRSAADKAATALQIASTSSKRMFELQKKLRLADAIIAGIKGVITAFADTPGSIYVKAAAAAAAGVFALAQISAIQATTYGGGGASRSVAGAANPGNTTQPGDEGQGGPQARQNITINVPDGLVNSVDLGRFIATALNEALADGAVLRGVKVI